MISTTPTNTPSITIDTGLKCPCRASSGQFPIGSYLCPAARPNRLTPSPHQLTRGRPAQLSAVRSHIAENGGLPALGLTAQARSMIIRQRVSSHALCLAPSTDGVWYCRGAHPAGEDESSHMKEAEYQLPRVRKASRPVSMDGCTA